METWFLVWNPPSDAMVARQTSERPRFCKFRESSSLKMLSSTDNNLLSSKQSFKIQLYASWWCWISSLFIRLFCFFFQERWKQVKTPDFLGEERHVEHGASLNSPSARISITVILLKDEKFTRIQVEDLCLIKWDKTIIKDTKDHLQFSSSLSCSQVINLPKLLHLLLLLQCLHQ